MRSTTRTLAFLNKWVAEVFRQPALMLTLIAGPFVILLAFGQGVDVSGPRPRIMIVRPPVTAGQELQPLPDELNQHVTIVGETTDLEYAKSQLKDGEIDGVAVLPSDPEGTVRGGKQVPLQVITDEIDPIRRSYARAYLADQVATLNRQTIARAITSAQEPLKDLHGYIETARGYITQARSAQGNLAQAKTQIRDLKTTVDPLTATADRVADAVDGVSFALPGLGSTSQNATRLRDLSRSIRENVTRLDAQVNGSNGIGAAIPTDAEFAQLEKNLTDADSLATEALAIPPEVLSAPFKLQLENLAEAPPSFSSFYAPAVLALLLQHLAVTLGALSLARVRIIGLMELLQVSPVRPVEVVNGNYLSYGSLCLVAAAIFVGLLVTLLGVPLLGSYAALAAVVVLLVVAGLGVGFVISLISSSEQQAAQIPMLILLSSIFFSGFVFSLDRVGWPVRAISYALPSTYAIEALQDIMLRGSVRAPLDFVVLGGVAVAFYALTLFLFRREFRST